MCAWRTRFKIGASCDRDTRSEKSPDCFGLSRGNQREREWIERDAIDSGVGHSSSCPHNRRTQRSLLLIAGRGGGRSDHGAPSGPPQEPGSDQHVEDVAAIVGVKAPQLDRLRFRQLQAGHFQEFTTHPVDDCGEAHVK